MDLFQSPEFQDHVRQLMEQRHVPGLAVAIIHNGDIASAGFGLATIDPPKPCMPQTLFDIASCSKSYTAACVGLLVEDEKHPDVRYDAIMSKLLPGRFVMPEQSYNDQVTVEDVLAHRTGLGRHDSSYMGPEAAQPDDHRSITENLRNLTVAAPIRTKFIYNNMMYSAAATLVEDKTGVPFWKFLKENIFGPLHMDSTNLQPSRARNAGLGELIATGYAWQKQEERYRCIPCREIPEGVGAGSIITSAEDDIKWIKAFINREAPISESVYEGLTRPRGIADAEEDDMFPFESTPLYAAGWQVSFYRGHRVIEHGGWEAGFTSRHFFAPELKFGAVSFGNSVDAGRVGDVVMKELMDELLRVPAEDRVDWPAVVKKKIDSLTDETEPDKVREKLYPGVGNPEPQERPLSAYTGQYTNVGYHSIKVEIKDGGLYVDASDRGMAFMLTFDHISEQRKYVAWMEDALEGSREAIKAEFRFEEGDDGQATQIGLHLEDDMEELIWFERVTVVDGVELKLVRR